MTQVQNLKFSCCFLIVSIKLTEQTGEKCVVL